MDAIKEKFLNAYVTTNYHVTKSCGLIGIDRTTFYAWKRNDEEFLKAFSVVEEERRGKILEIAEDRLMKLVEGVEKLDKNGKFIGWIVAPREDMVKLALIKLGKDKYGDVSQIDHVITSKKIKIGYGGSSEDGD